MRKGVVSLFAGLAAAAVSGVAAAAQSGGPASAVPPAAEEAALRLGGLLQVQADAGDRGDSRFTDGDERFYLRRARLTATGRLLEDFDFRLELDLAAGLADSSDLRAQMTDGYLHWDRHPAANLRVGQFKTPFGHEQLYGDPRLLTIERTLVNDRLTLSRQIGAQVGGEVRDGRLSYALGGFNGTGANENFNDNGELLWVGRLAGVPWRGKLMGHDATWSVGAGGYRSEDAAVGFASDLRFDSTPASAERDNLFAGTRRGAGADAQLVIGPFELWAEALAARFEPLSALPRATLDAGGWYVQAAHFVLPERLQVVVKYETFDPDRDRPGDSTDIATLGASYFLKGHDLKVMANYLHVEAPPPAGDDGKFLARIQVVF